MLVDAKFPPLGLHLKSQDVLLALPVESQPIKVSVYVYFSGRLSVSTCVYGSLLHRFVTNTFHAYFSYEGCQSFKRHCSSDCLLCSKEKCLGGRADAIDHYKRVHISRLIQIANKHLDVLMF